jgi:hypothetical protein
MQRVRACLLTLATLVLVSAPPTRAADPSADRFKKCSYAYMLNAGKAALCRFKAEGKFFADGNLAKRNLAAESCHTKFISKATDMFLKYGDGCPTGGASQASARSTPSWLAARLEAFLVPRAWAQSGIQYDIVEDTYGGIIGQVAGNGISVECDGVSSIDETLPVRTDIPVELGEVQQVYAPNGTTIVQPKAAPGTFHTDTDLLYPGETAIDYGTGLQWEVKRNSQDHYPTLTVAYTGECASGVPNVCYSVTDCPLLDCRTPGNQFEIISLWVAILNAEPFAGHTDWRIPTEAELNTIKRQPCGFYSDGVSPCTTIPGPTMTDAEYWTSTEDPSDSSKQLTVSFVNPGPTSQLKTGDVYVRAVRTAFVP